jgi:hypothetical protein
MASNVFRPSSYQLSSDRMTFSHYHQTLNVIRLTMSKASNGDNNGGSQQQPKKLPFLF